MFALALILAAAPAVASCGGAHPLMAGDGVGALRIGASVETVKQRCAVLSDTVEPREEDIPTRVLKVKFPPATVEAVVDEDKEKIWSIVVDAPALRTDTGLGVGSSISDLLRQPDLVGDLGEGDLYVFTSRHCGMSFRLDYTPNDRDADEAWTTAHLSRLPRTAKVVQVLLYGCGKL